MNPFFHNIPPDMLLIELLYFFAIFSFCIVIYYKTKDIYSLSKHKGISFFRNTFLYFGIAYGFRLIYMLSVLSNEVFFLPPPFELMFVSYFSTLAILSLSFVLISRFIKLKEKTIVIIIQLIALGITLSSFLTRAHNLMTLFHSIILLAIIVCLFFERHKIKTLTFNKLNFILLFIFWIIDSLLLTPIMLPIKMILYSISLTIFLSIYLRVSKRLKLNGGKKK